MLQALYGTPRPAHSLGSSASPAHPEMRLQRTWHPGLTLFSSLSGTQLEKLMENMRNDIASHPPVEGSYVPRRGEFCIAKFVDGEW